MKGLALKFNNLPLQKKAALILAAMLTLALCVMVPVFAWFYTQRKAAELYKVEFPNSLYLNAAQREDRMYFNMNAISPYKTDPVTGGLEHDEDGKLIPVNDQKYVFSVSGSNTSNYKIQLAHTNNNQFTYKIYHATQYSSQEAIPSGTYENDVVLYSMHQNSHTENDLQVSDDIYSEEGTKYYVKASEPLNGEYKNKETETPMKAKTGDKFYEENYGELDNVQEDDVPSYWQSEAVTVTPESGNFCDYYIIEVSWEKRLSETDRTFEKKETDMVYITAYR